MINLRLVLSDNQQVEKSKIGGSPVFPLNFFNEHQLNDDLFVAAINLEEFKTDLLPNTGMLYFFLSVESYPYTAKVIYLDDLNKLKEIMVDVNEGFEEYLNNQEYYLEITDEDKGIYLLQPLEEDNEYINLLTFDLLILDNQVLNISNPDDICSFIIKKTDLLTKKFDKVKYRTIGS